jgi:hypothetical protein
VALYYNQQGADEFLDITPDIWTPYLTKEDRPSTVDAPPYAGEEERGNRKLRRSSYAATRLTTNTNIYIFYNCNNFNVIIKLPSGQIRAVGPCAGCCPPAYTPSHITAAPWPHG